MLNILRLIILSLGVLSVCCLGVHGNTQENENDSASLEMVLAKLSDLEQRDVEQRIINANLQKTIKQLAAKLRDQEAVNKVQQRYMEENENRLMTYEKTMTMGKGASSKAPAPEVRDQHQALGCMEESINLECTNGGLITVTRAFYGQYLQLTPCSDACCAPNPGMDCTENVADNDPAEWAYLKYSCDNKTECNYVYNGAIINDCEAGYVADYILIYYSCLPGDENDYVAFTARASEGRYYDLYDIIIFDSVITNTGNHYNAETSAFVCPYDGVFSFSVSFYGGVNDYLYLDIMRDDEQIIRGYADYIDFLFTHGMSTVVIECNAGQLVWARCGDNGNLMYGGANTQSHFTGFALHRFS